MSRARKFLRESALPSKGDTVDLIVGGKVAVVDVGPFSELKRSYPEAAERALAVAAEQGIPEERLKTAWAIKGHDGIVYLVGSSVFRLFTKKQF